ncbi:MAG: DNA polymerase III subunit beta [Planctomycetota bacterium]|nr:MAG: DNA polymerase III subunit beta [Planctomycetota bacterium]
MICGKLVYGLVRKTVMMLPPLNGLKEMVMAADASITTTGFHVRCQRSGLVTALQAADAVVPSSSAKPILTNLLLDAHTDYLEIAATDLQVGLCSKISQLEIVVPGQVVVSARKLVNILKESRSRTVDMMLDQHNDTGQLIIELSDGTYRLPAVIGESFPQVSAFPEGEPAVTMPANILATMLKRTSFAVDRERTSAVLSGVLVRMDGEQLLMAATDGKVLAEYCLDLASSDKIQVEMDQLQAIIPAATVSHLMRILESGGQGMMYLTVVGKLIFVRIQLDHEDAQQYPVMVELTSRCIDGNYPPYRNALPSGSSQRMTFNRDELASAVRRTALMTSSASPGIILSLRSGAAELSNLFNTAGSVQIPLACDYQGEAIRMGLNAGYLNSVLKSLDGDEVIFELNGPGKGIITRQENSTYLVMPISLPNA